MFMKNHRFIMEKFLSKNNFPPKSHFRTINRNDIVALGDLLYEADLGTVDDEGLPVEDSINEIENTLSGKYGKFLERSSFVAIENSKPIAAVLFTFYEKESMPLLAFTMTHPKYKNKGLCKDLLQVAFTQLEKNNYQKCFLAVNAANLPAVAAYKRVGFEIRESTNFNNIAKDFWNTYLSQLPEGQLHTISVNNPLFVESSFAGNALITDELIQLIIEGKKFAGSSLVQDFKTVGDPLPRVGNFWIALDKNEEPKCILKTVRTEINKFNNITEEITKAEGEGDCTIRYWKQVHQEIYTPFLEQWGIEDLNETEVITEFFEVVFK
ncbi:MAG: GNAT family N-acetyltransferase [Bacteriovorax sp.]|nr:GNAT family N-acetyltransferase [Bacteriovorax sp.]